MGRVKIQMKKIEDRQQRNIAFAKRKGGILKKAYELCILCDVPIALIFFSPSGKLFVFYAKARIEEIIYKYVAQPRYKRPSLQDEPYIRRWINNMREESMRSKLKLRERFDDGNHYQIRPKSIDDEIDQCKVEIANVDKKLRKYMNVPNKWDPIEEIEYLETELMKTLAKVQARKKFLEDQSENFLEDRGENVDVCSWEIETSMEIS